MFEIGRVISAKWPILGNTDPCHDKCVTWAQCGAGDPLEGRALAEGSSIQRGRIGAAACAPLPAPPTLSVALWPFSPRGPASAHWRRGTSRWQMWVRARAAFKFTGNENFTLSSCSLTSESEQSHSEDNAFFIDNPPPHPNLKSFLLFSAIRKKRKLHFGVV